MRIQLFWSIGSRLSLFLLATVLTVQEARAAAHSFTWNVDANGSWDTWSNWTPFGVPGGNSGDTVTFDGAITASRTITLTSEQAKSITFNSSHGYTLNGTSLALGPAANGSFVQSGSGPVTMNVPVILGNDTIVNGSGSGSVSFNGAISGSSTLTVSGSYMTTFAAGNSFSGGLTVTSGATLQLNASGSAGSGNVLVKSGGTIVLGGSSSVTTRFGTSVGLTLNSGTLNTSGLSESIGTLSLLSNSSAIDLGAGSSVLKFAASAGSVWTSGKTLTIYDWSGSAKGGGADQLFFGTSSGGLTSSQLGEIVFSNPLGFSVAGNYPAGILANGEIVPIPEPATYLAAGCLLALAGYRERKAISALAGRAWARCLIS